MWLCLIVLFAQIADYNELPPLWKTRALLAMARQDPEKAPQYSKLAYETAREIDLSVEFKDYPFALKAFGQPEAIVAEAWFSHQKFRGPGEAALPFPERPKSSPARCEHRVLDSAEKYLRVAFDAGPDTFASATLALRSPLEIGSALDLLPTWDDARAVPLGMELIRRLRGAISSRREFEAAKDLSSKVQRFASFAPAEDREKIEEEFEYYKSRNQAIEPCGAAVSLSDKEEPFGEKLRKVIRLTSEFEFTEQLLQLYQMADGDQSRLDELEASGDPRVRALIRAFRTEAAKR